MTCCAQRRAWYKCLNKWRAAGISLRTMAAVLLETAPDAAIAAALEANQWAWFEMLGRIPAATQHHETAVRRHHHLQATYRHVWDWQRI